MLLKAAREIGHECGLDTDYECIRNITMHSINLFEYTKINDELNELAADCVKHGVSYNKAFDIVCIKAVDDKGELAYYRPNIPNNRIAIYDAKRAIEKEGYYPEIVKEIGE